MTMTLGDLIQEIGETLANADDTDILKIRQIGHRLITMANGPAKFLKHYTLDELQNMHNRKNYGEWN